MHVNAAEEEMGGLCACGNAENKKERDCTNAVSHLVFLKLSCYFVRHSLSKGGIRNPNGLGGGCLRWRKHCWH